MSVAAQVDSQREEYGSGAEAWVPRVGERVRYKDDRVSGIGTAARSKKNGWLVTVEEKDQCDAYFLEGTARFFASEALRPLALWERPPLRIEAGKFYRTRDGRKVGPIGVNDGGLPGYPWQDDSNFEDCWTDEGLFSIGRTSDYDLIAEWVDEPVAITEASNDNEAPEKFKVGDRVVFRRYLGGEDCFGTVLEVSESGRSVYAEDWTVGAHDGYLDVEDLELVSGSKPDATLTLRFESDFSELDAEILVRKKKIKKLIKLARKAGIVLQEAA